MNERLAPLLLSGALLLGLTACGGGEEDREVEAISTAIAAAITGGERSKCTELMTGAFVDQGASGRGAAALRECEERAIDGGDDPDEVRVSGVAVDAGQAASAEVAFVGGGFDGQALSVELVRENGRWKLDRFASFASYDPAALARTVEGRFRAASGNVTPAQVACIGDGIRDASQAEAEELLLSGDSGKFVEFAETCE